MAVILVHVPKTGTSSIATAMGASHFREKPRKGTKVMTFGHISIRELGLLDHYKAAFVREPLDRMVSLYHWMKSLPSNRGESISDMPFTDFVHFIYDTKLPPVGKYHVKRHHIANPQTEWIVDAEPDFIGRFERLQEDYEKLCSIVGIESQKLPHEKKSERERCENYYTKETKEMVYEMYNSDYELIKSLC